MSVLRVTKYGEKILRQKANPVSDCNEDIKKLIRDMFDTMMASGGIGLSAPQVDVGRRISVVNITPGEPQNQIIIINPEIVKREGRVESEEGCLSLPGLGNVVLKRAAKVTVRGVNELGLPVTIDAEGLLSRCLQHEIDHLDGIMIVNRAPLARKMELVWAVRTLRKNGLW